METRTPPCPDASKHHFQPLAPLWFGVWESSIPQPCCAGERWQKGTPSTTNSEPLAWGCQHVLLKPAHFLVPVHAVGMSHFGSFFLQPKPVNHRSPSRAVMGCPPLTLSCRTSPTQPAPGTTLHAALCKKAFPSLFSPPPLCRHTCGHSVWALGTWHARCALVPHVLPPSICCTSVLQLPPSQPTWFPAGHTALLCSKLGGGG